MGALRTRRRASEASRVVQREATPDGGDLHELQRTAGNRATTSLVTTGDLADAPAAVVRQLGHFVSDLLEALGDDDVASAPEADPRTFHDGDHKTLRSGSSGNEVAELQAKLNDATEVSLQLAVDGAFGPLTRQAVVQLQTSKGLDPDGVVGPKTWAAVDAIPRQGDQGDTTVIARKLFMRGADCYGRGDYAHAYDHFTRAHELRPRAALVFSRAQALRRLGGRAPEALALYRAFLADPGESAARVPDAEAAVAELSDPTSSGDAEVDRTRAKALFDVGAAFYGEGRYGLAYDKFTQAQAIHDRPSLTFSRAQCLRRLGARRAEAIALYQRFLADPGDSPARVPDAQEALAEVQDPTPTGDPVADAAAARALFEDGAARYGRKDYGVAHDRFEQAHVLSPRAALVFSSAQALRKMGGRSPEAIARYEAYVADPDAAPARVAEARFHSNQLREQGAEG